MCTSHHRVATEFCSGEQLGQWDLTQAQSVSVGKKKSVGITGCSDEIKRTGQISWHEKDGGTCRHGGYHSTLRIRLHP